MKVFSTLVLNALVATVAFAQNVAIGFPADGASVTAGSKVVVEIDRPNTLSGSQEVAIVIGLQSCATTPCHLPSGGLGNILYNGGYKPAYQPGAPAFKPPHQNFSIDIPEGTPKGRTQLGVTHVTLIGAGLAPFMETLNITLNVV